MKPSTLCARRAARRRATLAPGARARVEIALRRSSLSALVQIVGRAGRRGSVAFAHARAAASGDVRARSSPRASRVRAPARFRCCRRRRQDRRLPERLPELVVHPALARSRRGDVPEVFERAVEIALFAQRQAEVHLRAEAVRLEDERLFERCRWRPRSRRSWRARRRGSCRRARTSDRARPLCATPRSRPARSAFSESATPSQLCASADAGPTFTAC